jgi:predicted Zn-dependent peptidase
MVEKTVLPCGLTVISENLAEFPSLALSYSLKSGSRAENPASNGVHHLIEHMLFKGSRRFDLKGIADVSDRLGGHLNAYTSKEVTQVYIKSIAEKLGESFALISDIVFHSTFPEDEFAKEKNVIIQEIREADDSPENNAFETFFETIYAGNALGYPIGGKEKQVARLDRGDVFTFYRGKYAPENFLLSAAGCIRHRDLVALAGDFFASWPRRRPRPFRFSRARFRPDRFSKKNRSLNQCYVLAAMDSISLRSPLLHPFMLMNDILGAGMSSRLFQSIREEKGLAYTISSSVDSFLDCGVQIIYAVIEPGKAKAYLQALAGEIQALRKHGIAADELERAKDHIKSAILLGLEDNAAKMRFNASQELYLGREQDVAAIIAEIDATGVRDINGFCRRYLDLGRAALFTYGGGRGTPAWPFPGRPLY